MTDWNQLNLGERIVLAAWMAVREQLLADQAADDHTGLQSRLRSLPRVDRFDEEGDSK